MLSLCRKSGMKWSRSAISVSGRHHRCIIQSMTRHENLRLVGLAPFAQQVQVFQTTNTHKRHTFSTNSGNAGASKSKSTNRLVSFLNAAFINYPHETCVSMLSMEILSIYGTHSLLVYSGVTIPVEFALAFAMSRPLRRLRLPAELAGAALLSKYFPSLTEIKVTALSNVFPEVMRSQFREGRLKAGAEGFGKIIDKYGASYFISARWLGVSIVCILYGAVINGVDVSSYLEQYGFDKYGDVLGTWAAAVTLSATLYPATILCGGGLAHLMAKVSRRRW